MAFKHWPLVRELRFAQKCGRYLRGARKRRPDLNWDEFHRVARRFKTDDMGSFPERGFLYQLASDAPEGAQVVEVGSWMGASTCFLAAGLKGGAHLVGGADVAVHDFVREHISSETRGFIQRTLSNVPIGLGLATCWCARRAGRARLCARAPARS